jgi:hypothetical protein
VEIQQQNIKLCLENKEKEKPIFPLRIGINTSMVYIGDLGDDSEIEFTLVGHGVNYAKRLEEAAEMTKVLISATTKDLLTSCDFPIGTIIQKHLKIKHHTEIMEAYEIDPSYENPSLSGSAISAYQDFAGFERKEERWAVSQDKPIEVDFGPTGGKLVDFSLSGLSVSSNKYFSRGVKFDLLFKNSKHQLDKKMEQSKLTPISVEVRWGRKKSENEFVHGLELKNLNKTQRETLLNILREVNMVNSSSFTEVEPQ